MTINPHLLAGIKDPFHFCKVSKGFEDAIFVADLHWIPAPQGNGYRCIEEPDYYVIELPYDNKWAFKISGSSPMTPLYVEQTCARDAMNVASIHWDGREYEVKSKMKECNDSKS